MNFKPRRIIQAMIDFNRRVIYDGTVKFDTDYSMKDIRRKFFFTKIAYENVQELFQRWDTKEYRSEYMSILYRYQDNINRIISGLEHMTNATFIMNDEQIRSILSNILSEDDFITTTIDRITFQNKTIYFASKEDGVIRIRYTKEDVGSKITKALLDHHMICKTDDAICSYFGHNMIAMRVSIYDYNQYITKIEFHGDNESLISELVKCINPHAFIIHNPFILNYDISQWLAYLSNVEERYVQNDEVLTFQRIMNEDVIQSYPEDSFQSLIRLVHQAAISPFVTSIKMTLYRIGSDSTLIDLLCSAARKGKYVHVNLEMEAYGEKINAKWYQQLERNGVYVTTYERGELKVHAKTLLITFCNGDHIAQIGTGNYHVNTTSQYTDLSYYTSDPKICEEVDRLFHVLDDDISDFNQDHFLVTQYNCKNKILEEIKRESKKDGYIAMKCNALDDPEIIDALHNAEQSGCRIDLIVRGMNLFYPTTNRVHTRSFIWDKLEHSRVFCFGRKSPTIYLGSLDLVESKINRRIETLVRIDDAEIRSYLIDYFNRYITDTKMGWERRNSTGLYLRGEDEYFDALQEFDVNMVESRH